MEHHVRLPSQAVAAVRIRIKRRLRQAGIPVAWDATTTEMIAACGLLARGCRPDPGARVLADQLLDLATDDERAWAEDELPLKDENDE